MSRPDERGTPDELDTLGAKQSVDQLRRIVCSRDDVVIVHEPDGTLVLFSDGACALLGYARNRMSELPRFGWVASGRMRGAANRLEKVLHDGSLDFDSAALLSDGGTLPTIVSARRIDTERGPLILAVIKTRWNR